MENERLVRSLKNRIIKFANDYNMRVSFVKPYSEYQLLVFYFKYEDEEHTIRATPYCIISKYSTDLRKSLYDTFELVLKNNPILKQNRETLDAKRELIDITFNRNDIAKLIIGDELKIHNTKREIVIRMEE